MSATTSKTIASARVTPFGDVELTTPFNEAFKDELKAEIPRRSCRWDKDDEVWRVTEPWITTAINLLLEHFPNAQVPEGYAHPIPVVRIVEVPPPATAPISEVVPVPKRSPAPLNPNALIAMVDCPKCHERYPQGLRIVAETSLKVAKREKTPPELVSVCPSCHTLAVVAFFPAPALVLSADATPRNEEIP